jgi:hypothetical protein
MKIITILLLVLIPLVCFAQPFLVCDPQHGVSHYVIEGPSWVQSPYLAQPDGSLKMDLSPSVVGITGLLIKACVNDDKWGEVCSDSVPFEYARPHTAAAENLRLVK